MSSPLPCPPPGGPPLTLFCLPHAGGSALAFGRWRRALPPDVRVVPLELPGHGARFREPLVDSLDPLIAGLLREVRAAGVPRYAVFGHSLGALLAYELARALVAAGHPAPRALLVAGRNGPAEPLSHRPIHALPDAAFVAALERLGGVPPTPAGGPGLLRAYLPALRADLRLAETYTRRPGPPAHFPIAAFAGREDPLTDPRAVLGWSRETTAAFELTLMPAGHFFLDRPDFTAAVSDCLRRLSGGRGPDSAVRYSAASAASGASSAPAAAEAGSGPVR
jgi:medium-chain acyl-[acyl-carrier-protein] hydrolase